jgi:hypothetical protein
MESEALALSQSRWMVLFAMFGVGFLQGMGWMTFSGNPNVVQEYYDLHDYKSVIDFLLNWGPIAYLPVAPLVARACRGKVENVWTVVLSGALLSLAGLVIRLVPSVFDFPMSGWALWFLHLGQALNGCAGPMNAVTPSILAATWFPPEERAFATATVNAVQMAGPAAGFLLALLVRDSGDFVLLMEGEAALALLVAVFWCLVPRKPARPPSVSQALRETPRAHLCTQDQPPRRRWCSFTALLLSGGFAVGCFQVWTAALPTSLNGVFPASLLKWFVIITGAGSMVGNFGAGPVVERLGIQTRLCKVRRAAAGQSATTWARPPSRPRGAAPRALDRRQRGRGDPVANDL